MKFQVAILLAAATLVAACAHAPVGEPANASRAGAAPATAEASAPDGARDIVVTVLNPVAPPAVHAGSNVLGYGATDHYRNGQRAMSTLAALERRYKLREIAGWPIKPLGVYCAVLRPEPGADREALLAALSRDERVRIAEPLHEYELYAHPAVPRARATTTLTSACSVVSPKSTRQRRRKRARAGAWTSRSSTPAWTSRIRT
jgi:hypothetical protein